MKELLRQGYEKFTEDGLSGICRATSRQINRQFYDWTVGTEFNRDGVDIFEEDWDNLIILDACRFDYFQAYNWIDGTLESRISRGSTSREFIVGNFTGRTMYDTVYLSDNPWYGRIHEEIDADLYEYVLCESDAFDGTVSHPATVTESAIDCHENHPDKRLIVHYLQPHAPYFTADGNERFRWPSEDYDDCDPAELKEAYVDNLRLVLSETEKLLDELVGKTVVTADHGELLGERLAPLPTRQYQHPGGIYTEKLVKVPWLIVDDGRRKEITEGTQHGQAETASSDEIDDQLEALGYI